MVLKCPHNFVFKFLTHTTYSITVNFLLLYQNALLSLLTLSQVPQHLAPEIQLISKASLNAASIEAATL